ncbi:hypothetical protein T484DRAFT_1764443 [Baffinella frigidus]|nr:hypothetical protein T484DRAFT_1764443 [Cryptophyta sp. CCMP2293]
MYSVFRVSDQRCYVLEEFPDNYQEILAATESDAILRASVQLGISPEDNPVSLASLWKKNTGAFLSSPDNSDRPASGASDRPASTPGRRGERGEEGEEEREARRKKDEGMDKIRRLDARLADKVRAERAVRIDSEAQASEARVLAHSQVQSYLALVVLRRDVRPRIQQSVHDGYRHTASSRGIRSAGGARGGAEEDEDEGEEDEEGTMENESAWGGAEEEEDEGEEDEEGTMENGYLGKAGIESGVEAWWLGRVSKAALRRALKGKGGAELTASAWNSTCASEMSPEVRVLSLLGVACNPTGL